MSTDPPNGLLLSTMRTMLVGYMSENTPKAACQVVNNYGVPGPLVSCDDPIWTPSYATARSATTLASITTQGQGLRLLHLIAQFGIAIPSRDIPAMQACPDVLNFTVQEYSYLWTLDDVQPFCKVKVGDATNYNPISHVKILQGTSNTQDAVGVIINQYKAAITWLDPAKMRDACQIQFTYDDMQNQPFLQLCGCYIAVPMSIEAGFTSDEKQFLAQNPQCSPTCLNAAVGYVPGLGSTPTPCQQNICIADNINVTGDKTTIAQVCPQCPKRFQCVCYVHVNEQTLNNQTCSTVYVVDPQGRITETINNKGPPPGSGLKSAFEQLIHSKWALIVLAVAAGILTIAIIAVLISQHLHGRTKKGPRSIPITRREPLGYAMTSRVSR